MCSLLLLCNLLPLSPLTEWSKSLETCIICNGYHSLMVPVLPLADHNGPFSRLSESPAVSLIVKEWGRHVTWEETRGTSGPSFTCQEAGIRGSWHGAHTENGTRWQLQCSKKSLPFDPGAPRQLHHCSEHRKLNRVLFTGWKNTKINLSLLFLAGLFWFSWTPDQAGSPVRASEWSGLCFFVFFFSAGLKVYVLWLIQH